MDYDPEFSLKSSAELNSCLFKYNEEHDVHTRAVAELSRREKMAEDKMSRAVFWSRIAALLALPGALYVCWSILRSLKSGGRYAGKIEHSAGSLRYCPETGDPISACGKRRLKRALRSAVTRHQRDEELLVKSITSRKLASQIP